MIGYFSFNFQYGFGNVELGCIPCRCNETGTKPESLDVCDPVSGKCECKPGVFGLKCDTCLEGYYGFSENGCKCECFSQIFFYSSVLKNLLVMYLKIKISVSF